MDDPTIIEIQEIQRLLTGLNETGLPDLLTGFNKTVVDTTEETIMLIYACTGPIFSIDILSDYHTANLTKWRQCLQINQNIDEETLYHSCFSVFEAYKPDFDYIQVLGMGLSNKDSYLVLVLKYFLGNIPLDDQKEHWLKITEHIPLTSRHLITLFWEQGYLTNLDVKLKKLISEKNLDGYAQYTLQLIHTELLMDSVWWVKQDQLYDTVHHILHECSCSHNLNSFIRKLSRVLHNVPLSMLDSGQENRDRSRRMMVQVCRNGSEQRSSRIRARDKEQSKWDCSYALRGRKKRRF